MLRNAELSCCFESTFRYEGSYKHHSGASWIRPPHTSQLFQEGQAKGHPHTGLLTTTLLASIGNKFTGPFPERGTTGHRPPMGNGILKRSPVLNQRGGLCLSCAFSCLADLGPLSEPTSPKPSQSIKAQGCKLELVIKICDLKNRECSLDQLHLEPLPV